MKSEVSPTKIVTTHIAQRSERYVKYEFIEPKNTLFNEAEQIQSAQSTVQKENQEIPLEENNLNENNPIKEKNLKFKNNKNPSPVHKKGGRKSLPENLPRETKIHDLSEEEKICKNDLTPLVAIGEDIVEKLDVVPMSMKVIQHRYLKYACPCCEQNVVKAKAEPSMIPGSMTESGLLAHVTTNKYFFSLPLYRQEILFHQKEIEIPRITLARWMVAIGNKILPIVNEIKKYILSYNVGRCDETTVQVLTGTGKPSTTKSYMWVLASGLEAPYPAAVFQYYSNRSQESANNFLSGFQGFLQVDGYDGYNAVCNSLNVTRAGCWAHVRRKFESAFADGASTGKSLAARLAVNAPTQFARMHPPCW